MRTQSGMISSERKEFYLLKRFPKMKKRRRRSWLYNNSLSVREDPVVFVTLFNIKKNTVSPCYMYTRVEELASISGHRPFSIFEISFLIHFFVHTVKTYENMTLEELDENEDEFGEEDEAAIEMYR